MAAAPRLARTTTVVALAAALAASGCNGGPEGTTVAPAGPPAGTTAAGSTPEAKTEKIIARRCRDTSREVPNTRDYCRCAAESVVRRIGVGEIRELDPADPAVTEALSAAIEDCLPEIAG